MIETNTTAAMPPPCYECGGIGAHMHWCSTLGAATVIAFGLNEADVRRIIREELLRLHVIVEGER